MSELADRITQAVDRQREAIVSTLCDLVRINTINPYSGGTLVGTEKDGQLYLEPRFRQLGATTALQPLPDDVYAQAGIIGPANRDFTDRPNLVATFEFGPGPHVLVFGHMDTVAADDMAAPLEPVRRDGKVFGRGTSDDKGGLATALHAAEVLSTLGAPLAGTLSVASVVEEECNGGGAGIMALLLSGLRPDTAICVDDYSGHVCRGCAGVVTGHIDVPGVAGHAAAPGGVSALDKALLVKAALDRFKADREADRPMGLLNIGVFRAGIHPAVVPGSAEMAFNLVYFLDEATAAQQAGQAFSAALLRQRIEHLVAEAAAADTFLAEHAPTVTWVKDLPPYETSVEAGVLRTVCAAFQDVTREAPPVETMNGWSDAAHVPLMAGCAVAGLGVGAPGAAHAAGEYVEEAILVRNTKILALSLARLLATS